MGSVYQNIQFNMFYPVNSFAERVCTLGGGVNSYYNCNSATLPQNEILGEVLTHKLSFTKNHTPLQGRGKNFLAIKELRNSGEGSSRREKFCERSGGKYFFPSPRGRAREGAHPVRENSRERSEQNLLFPYYPISLFPFEKGGVPC